jgi:hypothetical protein
MTGGSQRALSSQGKPEDRSILRWFKQKIGVAAQVHVLSGPVKSCPRLDPAIVGAVTRGSDRILKDYTLTRKLGSGAFSDVYLAKFNKSGKLFACKSISKLSDAYDHPSLEKEIIIMKMINHHHCMRIFQVYDEETVTHIILELVGGSNMLDRLEAMGTLYTETIAAKVLAGCLEGLRCLHRYNKCILSAFLKDNQLDDSYHTTQSCYSHHSYGAGACQRMHTLLI